ncbi:MAG: MarR family transcriptional regulator [Proteobacteria bacterium]|nr:MarR family transcriptional regulator [Pseudomonadota bacterium]
MEDRFLVFPLRCSPGYLISRTALLMRSRLHRSFMANGFEITTDQWAVLNRLWEKDGLHQSLLAQLTHKDRHSITRILQIMERRELIVRRRDSNDSRRTLVFLSEKGWTMKEKLIPVVTRMLEEVFAGITDRELTQLQHLHEMILKNIENEKWA